MNNLMYHRGDDELLVVLMDTPTSWLVRNGHETTPASTLRQALRKAHEFSSQGGFSGRIVKQPRSEMVVDTHQISRLWKHINLSSY